MIGRLWRGASRRALLLLGAVLALLVAAPVFVSGYVLSILILALYFAYVGQAWNVMMGFAGQLSLGHALYVGLGAYVTAALFVKFGVGPWLGVWAGISIAMLAGALIGFLAFRFRIGGVYFALLTIAFAEFTRIGFDHLDWVGGSGGLFLRVTPGYNDVLNLRGTPVMFYYVALTLAVAAFLVCAALKASRIGYYWLAIREDQDAAQASGINVFRYKVLAVAISAALTAVAGVVHAFYYNNLYPEPIFAVGRSVEIMLGPIVGGLGTLFGPILGAFVLTALGESFTALTAEIRLDGIKQLLYGLTLLAIVALRPSGLWPWLRERLGLEEERPE